MTVFLESRSRTVLCPDQPEVRSYDSDLVRSDLHSQTILARKTSTRCCLTALQRILHCSGIRESLKPFFAITSQILVGPEFFSDEAKYWPRALHCHADSALNAVPLLANTFALPIPSGGGEGRGLAESGAKSSEKGADGLDGIRGNYDTVDEARKPGGPAFLEISARH